MTKMVSPKQLADAIGVSESSLKRWADDGLLAVHRTAGGHRRIPVPEAVRFVRHMGMPVVHPEQLGLERAPLDGADLTDPAKADAAFHEAIEKGDVATVRGIVQSLFLSGWSVAQIADGPIRMSMMRVGELWKHAEWGIVVEHRATDLCLQCLSLLRTMLPGRREGAPLAVGSAGDGDPYMLPSLAAAVSLAEVGFNEVNLGPATPAGVLANAVRHYRPSVVWLSLSHLAEGKKLMSDLRIVADAARENGAAVVVGGKATSTWAPAQVPGVHLARSMSELAAFARGHCAAQLQGDARPQ